MRTHRHAHHGRFATQPFGPCALQRPEAALGGQQKTQRDRVVLGLARMLHGLFSGCGGIDAETRRGDPPTSRGGSSRPSWITSRRGSACWNNQSWYDDTGTTEESQAGWGWPSVHDPAMLPSVFERWKNSIVSAEPFAVVSPLGAGDGSYRSFLLRARPVKDAAGNVQPWIGTNTDISALDPKRRCGCDERVRRARKQAIAVRCKRPTHMPFERVTGFMTTA